MCRYLIHRVRAPPPLRKSGTHFQILGGSKMCNQAEKIFLNFFLKGQGSPALYPIPFIPESNEKGGGHMNYAERREAILEVLCIRCNAAK